MKFNALILAVLMALISCVFALPLRRAQGITAGDLGTISQAVNAQGGSAPPSPVSPPAQRKRLSWDDRNSFEVEKGGSILDTLKRKIVRKKPDVTG